MPESYSTPVQIHRVNTRRRSLQALQCPLEPELLVAEFAGELPPDVAHAVREHIAICQTCGERSKALRAPYELLASLGHEPVTHVPDLRDSVHQRVHAHRFYKGVLRAATTLGRGGAVGAIAIIGLIAIAAFIVGGLWFSANAQAVARSSNTLSHVPAAAASGTLFVESDKLVTVTDSNGSSWQVAEVIAVDKRTGVVTHSLPASSQSLQHGNIDQRPVGVAVSPDGSTVYEVTAATKSHQQALVAFDTTSGNLVFANPLTYPDGSRLLNGNEADSLTLAPDGSLAYVGLNMPEQGWHPRALVVSTKTGKTTRNIMSDLSTTIPMAPPPGSLPTSVFPNLVPKLDASAYSVSVGANGALAVSSDGNWLFDVLTISNAQGQKYAVVQRYDANTGKLAQQLAIPGDFSLSELAASSPPRTDQAAQPGAGAQEVVAQQLYLVKGSPEAELFVLDMSNSGPTLTGTVALGGPAARPDDVFSGSLSASPSADGTQVYITQDASTKDGLTTGHDFWLVDTQGMDIVAHRLDSDSADAAQASSGSNGFAFVLRNGQVNLIAPDLSGNFANWLDLNSGNVVRFVGAAK